MAYAMGCVVLFHPVVKILVLTHTPEAAPLQGFQPLIAGFFRNR